MIPNEHLPAILVTLPILSSIIVMLFRNATFSWIVTSISCTITAFFSIILYLDVYNSGVISYAMGGWEPPIGIEYRIDLLNALLISLISIASSLIILYARRSLKEEAGNNKQSTFYSMYSLCLAGLIGILSTGDAFNAFVFLEISSLATYIMISIGHNKRALVAAYQYLIMGTIGATLYVIGVGLIFVITGSLNLVDISNQMENIELLRPVYAALAFITVGISLKIALFPLHAWLPNAYAYAPSVGTAFLSSTATKVAIYLLLKYVFLVFGYELIYSNILFSTVIIVLSIAAMFGASLVAIFQSNIKKLFAYSSISQIGYITLGVGIANYNGLIGSTVHIINHSIIKAAIFLVIGCLIFQIKDMSIVRLSGLGKRMPLMATCLTLSSISLIGIPGTVGFVSKWYLVVGAIEKGWWIVVLAIAISSILALIYVGRIIEIMWFQEPEDSEISKFPNIPIEMTIITVILTLATIYFGVDTRFTAGLATLAVENVLLGGAH